MMPSFASRIWFPVQINVQKLGGAISITLEIFPEVMCESGTSEIISDITLQIISEVISVLATPNFRINVYLFGDAVIIA